MTSKSGSAGANGSTAPKYEPRLCHVVKRPDFDGYGFNLHAEKGRPGQYIGKVDDGSPAESAGLRQGDRIIEVNGQNITTETHKKVVELIKAVPNETRLLVIDPRADANDLKMALAKAAAGLVSNGTANNNSSTSNGTANGHHETNGMNGAGKENGQKKDLKDGGAKTEEKSPKSSTNGMATVNVNNNNNSSSNNNNHSHSNGNGTTNAGTPESPTMEKIIDDTKKVLTVTDGAAVGKMALNGTMPPTVTNGTTEPNKTTPTEGKKLNLPMTAAEMRAQLAARKKYDPKSEVCDLRKKYEIIQKM